jgi:6-phosphogluconolactonase
MLDMTHRSPSRPAPAIQRLASHGQACAVLTARVIADLDEAISLRGAASLAVPGGSTPGEFLSMLGSRALDWQRVTVTLTDERWVAPEHPRSNAGLLCRTLGRHRRPYRWFPLWRESLPADVAAAQVEAEASAIPWPLDVVVLGMGDDGHVASIFHGDETAFLVSQSRRFVAVRGPDGEPRLSLTATALAEARSVYLLLRGIDKEAALTAALATRLPVARVLAARNGAVTVYSSP